MDTHDEDGEGKGWAIVRNLRNTVKPSQCQCVQNSRERGRSWGEKAVCEMMVQIYQALKSELR